jgi:uncharacterized membrane protein YeaQ/YmgE (transglycosylase-associated protein family)
MEQILINLVAGALGGNAAGKASPGFDLGTLGNTIAGLIGGGVLGQIITMTGQASSPRFKTETSMQARSSRR